MDFKTGYEEIESIRSQTSDSTYLTLIDWLNEYTFPEYGFLELGAYDIPP